VAGTQPPPPMATFGASDSIRIWTYVYGYLALMLDRDACD